MFEFLKKVTKVFEKSEKHLFYQKKEVVSKDLGKDKFNYIDIILTNFIFLLIGSVLISHYIMMGMSFFFRPRDGYVYIQYIKRISLHLISWKADKFKYKDN